MTKSGTICEMAKSPILLYKFHVKIRQLCTIKWQILQSFKTYLTLFVQLELSYFYLICTNLVSKLAEDVSASHVVLYLAPY